MEAYKYKGQKAKEVAKNLNMDMDDFLDVIFEQGYYYCQKCREIVDIEQIYLDDDHALDGLCDKCKKKKLGTWDEKRQIAIIWDIDDVQDMAKKRNMKLTDEQAFEILTKMKSQHDCTIGINWDTIDCYLDDIDFKIG